MLHRAQDARQVAEDNTKKVQESKIALLNTVDVLPEGLVDILLKEALSECNSICHMFIQS